VATTGGPCGWTKAEWCARPLHSSGAACERVGGESDVTLALSPPQDARTSQRDYGRGDRGKRVAPKGGVIFVRGRSYSVLAAISSDGVICWQIKEGGYNADEFSSFANKVLAPMLVSTDIVILDNCKIHKDTRFFAAVRQRGANVLFLPPYSPDYNPIEWVFSQLKAWLKRYRSEVVQMGAVAAIDLGLRSIPRADVLKYIHCAAEGHYTL
jgi:transposase